MSADRAALPHAAYRINVWVKNADSAAATCDADASMPFAIR